MLTRASRYFLSAALLTYLTGVFYGIFTQTYEVGVKTLLAGDGVVDAIVGPLTFGYKGGVGEHVGYIVLMAFAAGMALLGGLSLAFRDADATAQLEALGDRVTASFTETVPAASNVWPLVGGLSLAVALVGWALDPVLMWLGIAGVVIAGVEWTIVSWSESASGDPQANAVLRRRFMLPLEVPVGAALILGAAAFCLSRLLLALDSNAAIVVVLALTAVAFAAVVAIASRPRIRKNVAVGALAALAVLVVASGIVGAAMGERDVHKVSSHAELQAEHNEEEG